ncbi:MAG: 16S rRNA (uracil(1498)-N(3))-methyltransferase [bacterium]|nr:16S rRNA (uracil(1498)-N(3))-methyltransferase [bacterium]
MTHRRFFLSPEKITTLPLTITNPAIISRISRVLRLKPGDEIVLLDSEGGEYQAILTKIDHQSIEAAVVDKIIHPPPEFEVTLIQSLLKTKGMELVIQKAVELGADRIIPVITERSVARPEGKRISHYQLRLERIALAASTQSGRIRIPVIEPVTDFDQVLARTTGDLLLLLWEGEGDIRIGDILKSGLESGLEAKKAALFVGPEGGFTLEEVEIARKRGWTTVSLGTQRLRSETAAIVGLGVYEISKKVSNNHELIRSLIMKGGFTMKAGNLAVKIGSIEAQLEVLKGLNRHKLQPVRQRGLRSLKGILRGEGRFSEEELEAAKIRSREEL